LPDGWRGDGVGDDSLSGGVCGCDVAVYAWEAILEELDWRFGHGGRSETRIAG
jgi:hypothetical protein